MRRPVISRVRLAAVLAALGGLSAGLVVSADAAQVSTAPDPSTGSLPTPADFRQMLERYCVGCHGPAAVSGGSGLMLDLASLDDPGADPAVWEKVVRKLGVGAMPPQGAPTPGGQELAEFRAALVRSLDRARARTAAPGRYVVHRLNRNEYANAIRDLLDVELDITKFLPSDGGDFGFDNIATALKSSPMLIDGYLTAALSASELAIGDRDAEPGTSTYSVGAVVTQQAYVEGLPLGTRGGLVVRHIFPADGEYVFYGRLLRTVAEGYVGVEGQEIPHEFIVTIDGARVFSAPIGGREDHESSSRNIAVSGEEVDERMTSPRIRVSAGPHEVGFTFVHRPGQEQSVWQPLLRDTQEAHNPSGLPRLRSGNIEGPYNVTGVSDTPSRRRLFVCEPQSSAQERPCAGEILSAVARRAFRRDVDASDLRAPLAMYDDARRSGGDFEAGIQAGLVRILSSPRFVFRAEEDPADLPGDTPHRISDFELASRLSFFLWSSIPDDELLDLAAAGRLGEPGVLEAEVRRMLTDARADAMIVEFVGQWLQLRNLEKVTPDLLMFPDFDDNVRQAFRKETELLFAHILRENRSVLELLDADYTFLNERLARHYGVPGVYGSRFRRVAVTDPNRRGLLGHGSILSLTAAANRTSPVVRGKYVISNFMNTPPLPPPPAVFELGANAESGERLSVREQLALHSRNPVCSTCHRNMDPVGFALEAFDAVGQWREIDQAGDPIDSVGTLVDGTRVDGPVALREALLARPEVFAGTVTEKLMTYALGRGLEPEDMPRVRAILREMASDGYPLQSIVLEIVRSPAFQMRTTLSGPAGISHTERAGR